MMTRFSWLGKVAGIAAVVCFFFDTKSMGQVSCVTPPPGLISWWAGEGNTSDSAGNNGGEAQNGAQFTTGEVGSGFTFNGGNQYVRIPSSSTLMPTGSFSIEAWIYPTRSEDQDILSKWSNDQRSYVFAVTAANGLRFGISDSAHQLDGSFHLFDTAGQLVPLNAWSHVAAVYDQSSGRRLIYLNGVQVAERTDSPISVLNATNDAAIGARQAESTFAVDFFAGSIDEVSFYSQALSPSEVQAIFSANSAGKCPTTVILPSVITQPLGQSAAVGNTIVFTVSATGSGPLSYQWEFNGANIQGATSSVFQLANVQASNAGDYKVVVSSPYGSILSSAATLTVQPPPVCTPVPNGAISSWTGDDTAADLFGGNAGSPQSGTSFVTGKVRNAFNFNGANQYVRIPSNPTLIPSGSFSIEAWIYPTRSGDQDIFSKWSNDQRSYIFAVTAANGLRFGISDATHQLDNSFHIFDTAGQLVPLNAWSHVAAVYDQSTGKRLIFLNGAQVAERTDAPISVLSAGNDAAIGARQARSTFAVDFFSGSIDEISFYGGILSDADIQAIFNAGSAGKCFGAPSLVTQPQSQTAVVGDSIRFQANANGGPFSYQWRFNGSSILGATNSSFQLSNVQIGNSGTYNVAIANPFGTTVSSNAVLTVQGPPDCVPAPSDLISWWPGEGSGSDSLGNNSGTAQNAVSFQTGQVGQAFGLNGVNQYVRIPSSATLLPTGSFSIEAWIYPTQSSYGDILSKWSDTERSYVFHTTPENGLRFGISDAAHQLDASFHLFETPGNVVPLNTWSHVAAVYDQTTGKRLIYANGVKVAERTDSPITVFAAANDAGIGARQASPSVALDFFGGQIDEVSFYRRALSESEIRAVFGARSTGKCPLPPVIVNQPTNQVVFVGGSATFQVNAGGSGVLSYQWRFNGANIPGSTSSVLVFSNVQSSRSGVYSVVVISSYGSVESSNANLTVTTPTDCTPLASGAISWWTGDDNASDLLGGNHGSLPNGAFFAAGKVGDAFTFNGVNQYVRIPSSASLIPSGSFSIEAWVYPTASRDQDILSKWSNTQRSYILALTAANGLRFGISDTAHQLDNSFHIFDTAGQLVPLNAWSHVAAVYDQSTGRRLIYLNGVQVAVRVDAPITVLSATNDAAIGARQALTSSAIDFFDGKIDEVTFYGSALSQQELSAIYNAGSQGKCRSELPVLLQNATATFSQTQGGDYSAASMIDGITTDNRGWGIYPNITNQTSVFETRNDVGFSGGTVFTFSLLFNVISTPGTTAHTLGHFRLSGTTDPRDSFADGLQTGGDVTANWSVLDIISATSQSGAVLTPQPDGSLLVSGALNPNDLYTVVMATRLTGITGIRLEALTDPSLPFNGPGREPLDGNFHVAEFTVSARPGLAPAITQQPASSTVSAGESASLNVVASSSLLVTYQWFLNGATIQNATNTSLTVTNAQLGDAGTYTVSISSSEGTIMSAGAVLNVLPSNASNGATLFVSNQTPTNAPIYDMNGFLLAGPRYLAQVFAAGSDGVYRAASPAVPFLSGADAGFFTPVNLILPDVTPGGTARIFLRVWDSSAGSNYDQAVANGGQHGASDFIQTPTGGAGIPTPQLAALTSFSLVAPPKILTQAANATVFAGQNASFQIQTSGSAPLTYQWSFNSNEIAGATSATLNLTNVQVQQTGAYSVVVSNPLGLAASIPTILTVKIPDTNGPVMVITSPLSGVTFDDRVTLSGSITDNVAVASAKWENNGQTGGSITLQNGQFSIPNLTLTRGTNVLRLTAVDTSSNQTSASVTVVLQASRVLSVGQVASSQEGARVSVPIMLASRGDVSGVTFSLNYDRNYLEDPEIVWDDTLQGAFTQNNTNAPGTVRGSFALSGLTLSAGTQHVANIFFHARSVPQTQEISLPLVQSGIFSVTGDPLTTGTDVLSGYVEITRRKYVGDNNANDRLDVGDASEIMRLVNGLETPRPWDVAANDLNKNNLLDVGDVIRVVRAVVGLDQQPGSISQQSFPSGQSARPQIESPVPLPLVMEPAPSVILGVDKQRAAAGDKITVKVNLSAFSGALSGASLKVEYPAAALRLDSASSFKTGAIVPANAINASNLSPNNDYANQDGTISLAVSTDADWATNNGTLAEFTFTVQPGATNQYLWPIQINPVELSSGFDLVTVPGAETTLIGRDAIPASLGGTYNPKDGKFQFSLSGEPGVRYRIEVSDDLKTWSELSTTVNTDGQLEISDPAAGQKPSRFYRAVQLD